MGAIINRELRKVPKGWRDESALLPDEMPDVSGILEENLELIAYETTSEGTPISPNFPNTYEGRLALVAYCTEHCSTFANIKADGEAWAGLLFGDASGVTDIQSGQTELTSGIH